MTDASEQIRSRRRDLRRPSPAFLIIGRIVGLLIHRFGRLEVTGREHVPAEGAVLVSNHVGWLDPIWIAAALWPRPGFYMAKKELFVPVLGGLISAVGAFPIDRRLPGPSALKVPLEILRDKGIVVVFPGGTRSAELGPLKRGAATIAMLAACPILPAKYRGPSRLRLRDLLRRPRVSVEFLPPIHPAADSGERADARREMQRLSGLIKERLDSAGALPPG